MLERLAFGFALVTSVLVSGCGGGSSTGGDGGSGGATGGAGGSGAGSVGSSCGNPLVLHDHWNGTQDFTEPFTWGAGTFTPDCHSTVERPAVFIRWIADKTEPNSFKVLVDGSETITLEIFAGDTCSGAPLACTDQKIAVGTPHVAGAYVPVVDGQPITVVVAANESSAPSGDWTVFMGD